MLVESVMTRAVVTTEPSRSVHSAALLMREGRFRHLPVLLRDRLVGIVSDRDVTVGHEHRTVGEVMSMGADTTPPASTIACNGAPCSAGYYNGPVQVSLASADNAGGSGVSAIRYTADGTTPTKSRTRARPGPSR